MNDQETHLRALLEAKIDELLANPDLPAALREELSAHRLELAEFGTSKECEDVGGNC